MTISTVISYPIPAYQNLPIEAQYYQPTQFFISTLTLGPTTVVTTTANHNYVIGQLVRLLIPQSNGTYQLNGRTGYVVSIPASNQVEVNISSLKLSAFTTTTDPTQPQILAIGDINQGPINANGNQAEQTYIPGSFINISPN